VYIYLVLTIILALALATGEARTRSTAVETATRRALVQGLESGCDELSNPTRAGVQNILRAFEHREQRQMPDRYDPKFWKNLYDQVPTEDDCRAYAEHRADYYTPVDP